MYGERWAPGSGHARRTRGGGGGWSGGVQAATGCSASLLAGAGAIVHGERAVRLQMVLGVPGQDRGADQRIPEGPGPLRRPRHPPRRPACFDLGDTVNKVAYTFATAGISVVAPSDSAMKIMTAAVVPRWTWLPYVVLDGQGLVRTPLGPHAGASSRSRLWAAPRGERCRSRPGQPSRPRRPPRAQPPRSPPARRSAGSLRCQFPRNRPHGPKAVHEDRQHTPPAGPHSATATAPTATADTPMTQPTTKAADDAPITPPVRNPRAKVTGVLRVGGSAPLVIVTRAIVPGSGDSR